MAANEYEHICDIEDNDDGPWIGHSVFVDSEDNPFPNARVIFRETFDEPITIVDED